MSEAAWEKFFDQRTRPLWERFPGQYRALVVETNDPLNMRRVRFKCPEMHDYDLAADDCPWAVPAFDLGGFRAGRFSHPIIGDWIWITFEKQHPYGPIWTGFADPTRRKRYTYPGTYTVTPVPVNDEGKTIDKPQDYDKDYLPKDGRPMSHGWQDRYGNLDIHSSVGFFPNEHAQKPPPADHDAVQGQKFDQQSAKPEVNNPDLKYMARVTKYGNIHIMGDQGYHWKKDGSLGEFEGDFKKDEQFETKRWLALQQLLNEGVPRASDANGDQRRQQLLTRYGHLFEMRDTGWAQEGPRASKSREGEFGPARTLSKETTNDYRWIKLRTKGGMLFQASDIGFDPQDDKFIKRKLLEECGPRSEQEDKYWAGRDARWIRFVTRYGIKLVFDDRGSDDKDARNKESPRGIGILMKGRRTPGSKKSDKTGDCRGFYWEFNEADDANHTSWGSPLGQSIEINDRYQYIMLAASLGHGWSRKWQHIKDNEFLLKPSMLADPENKAHHLKIDHDNEYIRFKTRAGKGTKPDRPSNQSDLGSSSVNQGFEARDGSKGDGAWVELVDAEHRGIWFSRKYGLSVLRGKENYGMYQWFDEQTRKVVIYNYDFERGEPVGVVEIFVGKEVNIISKKDVTIQAAKKINIKSGDSVCLHSGGTKMTWRSSKLIESNAIIKAVDFVKSPNGDSVDNKPDTTLPARIEPTDRGKTYNKPFEAAKEP